MYMCEYLYTSYETNCSVVCSATSTVTRGIFASSLISPHRIHATTAAAGIGGATATPAVVHLRCIVESGFEYAYYFVGSTTYLPMPVPGTWYLITYKTKSQLFRAESGVNRMLSEFIIWLQSEWFSNVFWGDRYCQSTCNHVAFFLGMYIFCTIMQYSKAIKRYSGVYR